MAKVEIKDNSKAWANASQVIAKQIASTLKGVEKEVATRAYRASNELRNASVIVLRGTRTGRIYKMPTTNATDKERTINATYRASAPGESPAVRTGGFRNSWGTHIHVEKVGVHFKAVSGIESKQKVGRYLLGDILEEGTANMLPRPYKEKVIERALPKVKEIYSKSYNV